MLKSTMNVTRERSMQGKSPTSKKQRIGNVHILESRAISCLLTVIRDKSTPREKYVRHSDRLFHILCEEALALLPSVAPETVQTPCGPHDGLGYNFNAVDNLCAVSILRSGNIALEAVRAIVPDTAVGYILIQRDEESEDKHAVYFYSKFPGDIAKRFVLLVDPMLATGGSALAAMKCLVEKGVKEENVIFVNLVCVQEGIDALLKAHPGITIVTCAKDPTLNEHKYIVPGVGDFGDRYYGTTSSL